MVALFAEPLPEVLLRGPRIYLRPPRRSDFRSWVELRGISRDFLVPWEPSWPDDALTRACYRRRLRRAALDWREDIGYAFHVVARSDDRLLGGIGLNNVRRGVSQSASVGYWLGEPYARQGYMTEGLMTVLRFAFDQLALHRIEAACLPANQPSRNLLLKIGFREEGLARKYLRINGAWEDHMLFGILRDEAPG
jgi:ribosomal-protein-alanine N-acetyltransferase